MHRVSCCNLWESYVGLGRASYKQPHMLSIDYKEEALGKSTRGPFGSDTAAEPDLVTERDLADMRSRQANAARRLIAARNATRGLNEARGRVKATASTRGIVDPVEAARRHLAGLQATDSSSSDRELQRMRSSVLPPTRGLELLQRNATAGLSGEDDVEKMRRELQSMRATGSAGDAMDEDDEDLSRCLHQEAAIADIKRLNASGGVAANTVEDSAGNRILLVEDENGNTARMTLDLAQKMIEHATNGCDLNDTKFKPCANCMSRR